AVTMAGRSPCLRMFAAMMTLRSRLTGIATGDQAMFATRAAFVQAGGFPDIALMEDIVLSRRLKALGRPACLPVRVTTSGRRWDRDGVVRTIFLMWRLRLAVFLRGGAGALARPDRLCARPPRGRRAGAFPPGGGPPPGGGAAPHP